jgi:hypothetical protein
MANCPYCGSNHVQLRHNTSINTNWGRSISNWALLGAVWSAVGDVTDKDSGWGVSDWALLGVAGGAVRGVTDKDRHTNACLDCGTIWDAEDIYKSLQVIESWTGERLDLSRKDDRLFLEDFLVEIGPKLEALAKVRLEAARQVKRIEAWNHNPNAKTGCVLGSFGGMVCATLLATFTPPEAAVEASVIGFLIPLFIGLWIGVSKDAANKPAIARQITDKIRLVKIKVRKAEADLELAIDNFMREE